MSDPIKLNLASGPNKLEGYTSVDLYAPGVDMQLDLLKFPWPWEANTVDEIFCSHFVEHIPAEFRWRFFEECYRVMKPGAVMRVYVPNWKSERSYGDMTHEWPPVVAFFFLYLGKQWREINKLNYGPYDLKCDFDYQAGPGGIHGNFATRSHEVQLFACQHYAESYQDMWVSLVKKA